MTGGSVALGQSCGTPGASTGTRAEHHIYRQNMARSVQDPEIDRLGGVCMVIEALVDSAS